MCNCESLNKAENGLSNAPVTSRKAKKHQTKAPVHTCVWTPKAKQTIKRETQTNNYITEASGQPSPGRISPQDLRSREPGQDWALGLGTVVGTGPWVWVHGRDWALGLGTMVGAGPYTLAVLHLKTVPNVLSCPCGTRSPSLTSKFLWKDGRPTNHTVPNSRTVGPPNSLAFKTLRVAPEGLSVHRGTQFCASFSLGCHNFPH